MRGRALLRVYRSLLLAAATIIAAGCADPVGILQPDLAKGGRGGGGGSSDPLVQAVAPAEAPQDVTLDITVTGSGFDRGSGVRLEVPGTGAPAPGITTNRTTYLTPKKLVANITIAGSADPVSYDVAVTTSGGKRGIGAEQFTVLAVLNLGAVAPDGSVMLWASEVNEAGQVAGATGASPFFWSQGSGLQLLMPGLWGYPLGLNRDGTVVGYTCGTPPGGCSNVNWHAVAWQRTGTGWEAIQVSGAGSTAAAITDGGIIYGEDPAPVRWISSGGGFTREPLPLPAGRTAGNVRDANNTGQVVGGDLLWSFDPGGPPQVIQLPNPVGTSDRFALDVGDIGSSGELYVVGSSLAASGYRVPVRWRLARSGSAWQVAGIEVLGGSGPSYSGAARGVNSSGDAVGYVYSEGGVSEPMFWPAQGAPMVLPHPGGSHAAEAWAISNLGWVVGNAEDPKLGRFAALWVLP